MAWEDIGENIGDKIYKLEKTIEDLRETSYNAQYNIQESYGLDSMSETDSPDSTSSFPAILRGPVTLKAHTQVRMDNEAYEGSTLYDAVIASGPYIIVKPKTTENPITIKWILGAMHDGQIVVLEPFYKWAGDSNTTVYSLQLQTGGNINISSNITISRNEKIMLQWTENVPYYSGSDLHSSSTSGSWTVLSSPQSSSSWVGTAGSQLNMGAYSIVGAWGGTANTLGIQSDLDMNTYDIKDVDRMKFSTTAGSGSSLGISDTGIEAIYSGSNPYGMKIQFPSTNSGVLVIYRGSTEMMNINAFGTTFTDIYPDNVIMGDKYIELGDMTSGTVGTVTNNKIRLFCDSGNSDHMSIKRGSSTVVDLEGSTGNSTSFVGFTADDDLSMGTYNIDGVDQLIFSTSTSSDLPTWNTLNYGIEVAGGTSPTALDIRVPTGKFVNVKVAGTTEFTFKNNELDCLDNDLCNVGTIFTDYISKSSGNDNVRVWGHLNPISDGDYDLGSTSLYWRTLRLDEQLYTRGNIYLLGTSKFIDMSTNNLVFSSGGRVDFANDTGTPTGAGGYVRVKIGGVDKWMPYYN